MESNDILINYSTKLLKIIFKEIESIEKKLEKAGRTREEASKTFNGVISQRHWKSVGDEELYIKEINEKMETLNKLDELCRWSELLHQDRLKFIEKYDEVLKKYKFKYNK